MALALMPIMSYRTYVCFFDVKLRTKFSNVARQVEGRGRRQGPLNTSLVMPINTVNTIIVLLMCERVEFVRPESVNS